jgi:predicted GIY-YIG superfamily endonuclease
MHYAYIIETITSPKVSYIGYTADLRSRLAAHNAGQNRSTAACRPWKLRTYLSFDDKKRARSFEKYLKSGSGRAFATRRL